jgi:hypothetical protein
MIKKTIYFIKILNGKFFFFNLFITPNIKSIKVEFINVLDDRFKLIDVEISDSLVKVFDDIIDDFILKIFWESVSFFKFHLNIIIPIF